MTDEPISPLRRRMIEDMKNREFSEKTQCHLAFGNLAIPRVADLCPSSAATTRSNG